MKLSATLVAVAALGSLVNTVRPASVGPAGYTNDFSRQPLATDWSTLSIAGAAGDATTAEDVDTNVGALVASVITGQLEVSNANPPYVSAAAVWCTNGYVQTRPTSVRISILMATLVNYTGTNANMLHASYDYATKGTTNIKEEVPGQRVYYSQTGASNSWTLIPALSQTAQGTLSADIGLASLWTNSTKLYLLWADDNCLGTPDDANQISNFFASANFVNSPPTVAIRSPAMNQAFVGDCTGRSKVTLTAIASLYVNNVSFLLDGSETLVASATASPFSVILTNAAVGPHSVVATARDTAGNVTSSVPISFTVLPDLVIDSFQYATPAEAQANWPTWNFYGPGQAGQPGIPATEDGVPCLALPCAFSPNWYASWSRDVNLDLSIYSDIVVRLKCTQPNLWFSLWFQTSAGGWYSTYFNVTDQWRTYVLYRRDFGTEYGTVSGWNTVTKVVLMTVQSVPPPGTLFVADLRAASSRNRLPNSGFEVTTADALPDCWAPTDGPDGCAMDQWITNMTAWRARWGVDRTVSHSGTQSLRIVDSPNSGDRMPFTDLMAVPNRLRTIPGIMAYLALIHGSRGLMYYQHKPRSVELWDELRQLTREVRLLTPVLYSTDTPPTVSVSPAGIHLAGKNFANRTYLIAVNDASHPVAVRLTASGSTATSATVLFENRSVPVVNGEIIDNFAGYERHVYALAPPQPALTLGNSTGSSQLRMSWTPDFLGWIAQSNAANVADTNRWFDITGSQLATNLNLPISSAATNTFYRLRHPLP